METKDIIRTGRERLGMTHAQFAAAVGVSRGAVQQWEKGDTAPKRGHQKRVADVLGITVAELMNQSVPDQKVIRDTVNLSSGIKMIPRLDRKTAGMHETYTKEGKQTPTQFAYVMKAQIDGLFAYYVDDDVMEPRIPKGCDVVIRTDLLPKHGHYVLVQDGDEAYIRRLVVDGQTQMIESPKYPARPMPGRVIGVVHQIAITLED